jgi:hypothetical protein
MKLRFGDLSCEFFTIIKHQAVAGNNGTTLIPLVIVETKLVATAHTWKCYIQRQHCLAGEKGGSPISLILTHLLHTARRSDSKVRDKVENVIIL